MPQPHLGRCMYLPGLKAALRPMRPIHRRRDRLFCRKQGSKNRPVEDQVGIHQPERIGFEFQGTTDDLVLVCSHPPHRRESPLMRVEFWAIGKIARSCRRTTQAFPSAFSDPSPEMLLRFVLLGPIRNKDREQLCPRREFLRGEAIEEWLEDDER